MMLILLIICVIFVRSDNFIDVINTGYDVRKLQQLATPLFDFTYTKNKTYMYPARPEFAPFSIPNEVAITNKLAHNEQAVKSMYSDYHSFLSEYISSYTFGFHINLKVIGIGVDVAHEAGHIRETITSNASVASMSEISYNLFSLKTLPQNLMKKGSLLAMFNEKLPTEIKVEMDVKILKEFIMKFGTHYTSSADFGGKMHFDSALKESYVKKQTQDWCKTQIDLYFRYKCFVLAPGLYTEKGQIKVDEEFIKNSDTTTFFYGGLLKYQSLETLNEWFNSIYESPQMIGSQHLNKISNLIDDPVKRTVLDRAIDQYLKTGDVVVE